MGAFLGGSRGPHKTLNGEFVEILEFAAGRRSFPFRSSRVMPSVVAGPRNQSFQMKSTHSDPSQVADFEGCVVEIINPWGRQVNPVEIEEAVSVLAERPFDPAGFRR